jgi:DNA-binding PadR family transcriptional regulator
MYDTPHSERGFGPRCGDRFADRFEGRHGRGGRHGFGPGRHGGDADAGDAMMDPRMHDPRGGDDPRRGHGRGGRFGRGFGHGSRHGFGCDPAAILEAVAAVLSGQGRGPERGGFGRGFGPGFGRGFGPGGPHGGPHGGPGGGRGDGGGDGRGGDGHGRGGRGGLKRFFAHGDLKLLVLHLIAEKPRHGYDIIKAIEERVAGAYSPSPGVVYPTLTLLEEMGFVTVGTDEGGKKTHAITPQGQAYLDGNRPVIDAILARMADAGRGGGADAVFAAMDRLRQAVRARLDRAEVSEADVVEVVAALQAAASRLEQD